MAGEETTAGAVGVPLRLVRDIDSFTVAGFSGLFKEDCTRLGRRVYIFAHLLEEIRDSEKFQLNGEVGSPSFSNSLFSDLILTLQAAKRLLIAANNFDKPKDSSVDASKEIFFQFKCVTYKLEKALADLPYNDFDISEEVQEWVELIRLQLRRAREKCGPLNSNVVHGALSQLLDKEIDQLQPSGVVDQASDIDQPKVLINGRIKKSDGSFRDVIGDLAAMEALVRKLSNGSVDEKRATMSEIRLLSKRSADNRVLLAQAGAIPIIVYLLTSDDAQIQDNAITSILNLSMYDDISRLIMLANAIPSIVQVLRDGSVKAKEDAAGTLFILSIEDENKKIIRASGAIPSLMDLLENGSQRGKKDAATALLILCTHGGNKGRAIRAGIITTLSKMLTDSSMADEALTILSVIANHQEAKTAIVKADMMPVLVDVLRSGLPRCKENASAVLLSICKKDGVNLACVSRLGAGILLAEIVESGTDRAKRNAKLLLEHILKFQTSE